MQVMALPGLISEVLDLYASEEHKVAINFQAASSIPLVEIDPGRIRQLLHNLIRNAIESLSDTDAGKVELRLELKESDAESWVTLTIEDNGPGIPEDMLDKLFEPYATSKSKGSGLGLAVVKRIVEEHSGVLFAENCADGGARVVVRLPAVKSSEAVLPLSNLQAGR
jgi:signal transduction histidine kinase